MNEFQLPWGSTKKSRKDARKLYDKFDRSPESVRFFNSKPWKATRKRVLDANPLCARCKERGFVKEATVVDHVIPRSQIPIEEWLDIENLSGICHRCHNFKTAEDYKKYGTT